MVGICVATVLDKELRRQVNVDGMTYTIAFDADGLRLIGKGKRKPEVVLRWRDLLNGDAAMAAALNASLGLQSGANAMTGESNKSVDQVPPKKKPARR